MSSHHKIEEAIDILDQVVNATPPESISHLNVDAIYQALNRLKHLEQELIEKSWQGDVDRQGGSFTEEEIHDIDRRW